MAAVRKRPFEVSEDLYPFEDHWFEREGAAMHYIDHGSGIPVVMLHGNPSWSFLYRDVIKALGPEVRCLAPDYPGFGFSDHPEGYGYEPPEHAEWVGAWLDDLGIDRFVLVVQDWGGPIGLSVAVDHPDRVAGVVLLNTWAWKSPPSFLLFSYLLGGPFGKYLNLQRNFFATTLIRNGIYYAKAKPPEVFAAYADPFPTPELRQGTYAFPRAIRQHQGWLQSIENRLGLLREKPMEMVWAMKDFAFATEAIIARFQSHFPDAPLTRLEKASHYLQEDQPEVIADAIKRVLAKLD